MGLATFNRWRVQQMPSIRTMTATEPTISASVTTYEALAANNGRIYALFVNDSDTAMYLRLGEDAVVNQGVRIAPNGGWYEINGTNLYHGAVNVACAVAAEVLLVTEGT